MREAPSRRRGRAAPPGCPTRPSPITPSVLPCSSMPSKLFLSQTPERSVASALGTLRACERISAMVCSAAEITLAAGALTTSTPAAVAASRSMLSTPIPARPITWSDGAAEISSASTAVADRTRSPWAGRTSSISSEREAPTASITSACWPSSASPMAAIGSATTTTGRVPTSRIVAGAPLPRQDGVPACQHDHSITGGAV